MDTPLNAHFHEQKTQLKAPYAAEVVRQQLEQMYGNSIYTDGFNVYTTIDSKLQEAANAAIWTELLAYDQRHGYRGPERNLGSPTLENMQEWESLLSNIPTVNQLEPAAVVDMSTQSVTVLRANGTLATIPWRGLAWARRQINADYLGRAPKKANDILKLGDLIRIMPIDHTWRLAQIPTAETAFVALNPNDGKILALVGGFDYNLSNFNRATNAERQPGSSFKPFIYSAALEKGYTLATLINDAPIVVENPTDNSLWRPQNDEHRFFGPTRLREALTHSRNLVSIRLLDQIKVPYAVSYAQKFGFTPSQLPPTLSLALGTASVTPLQLATAYAVFANGGFKVVPYAIDRIQNTQGDILYQATPLVVCDHCQPLSQGKTPHSYAPRVITAQNAFLITSALREVIQSGTAAQAKSLKRDDLAGKTGTTNNQVDAWFVGYHPDLVALAWVGFDQPQSLHEYGAQAALPIWIAFMQPILRRLPSHPLEQPAGIVNIKIDPQTGKRANTNDPMAQFEYFMSPYVPDEDTSSTSPSNTTQPREENNLY